MHMGSGMCTAKFGWNADESEAEGSFEEEAEGSVEEETEEHQPLVLQRPLRGPNADHDGDMGTAPILIFGRRLVTRKVKRGPSKGRKVRMYVGNVFYKY